MRKFAKALKKFLFIAVPVVILASGLIYAFNTIGPDKFTTAIQQLTGQGIPSLQMPAEAQEQVFQGGYTILSSQQSSAPQNLRWGLGLSNRDYEEVWCVTAQNALGTSGLLVVRRGRLWSIVYPENVPPGNTPDVFLSLNCQFGAGR